MRNCPHCNKEIQDEAVFCRFCRQDVEPPLWLTSLRKCPYCAEWIERGIDRCPLCGKDLTHSQPFTEKPEAKPETEDLLAKLRGRSVEATSGETAAEPTAQPAKAIAPSSELNKPEPVPPNEEGLALLHSERLGKKRAFDPVAELHSEQAEERKTPRVRRLRLPAPLLRIGAAAIALAVLIAAAYFGLQRLPQPLLALNAPTASPSGSVLTATPASTLIGPVPPPATLPPLASSTPTSQPCRSWDEITIEDEGEVICAYGNIRRWFKVEDIPFVAIFTEELGTFAIVDRTKAYYEFKPGTCITVEGPVEIMRGSRPFIDANGNLRACEPEGS